MREACHMRVWSVLLPSILGIMAPGASEGAVRRVPEDFSTIQAAVTQSGSRDTVLVGPGTYTGAGNRDIDFGGVDVAVISRDGPEATLLDCERAGRGFYLHSYETSASRIEGLTIRNGYVGYGTWL